MLLLEKLDLTGLAGLAGGSMLDLTGLAGSAGGSMLDLMGLAGSAGGSMCTISCILITLSLDSIFELFC